MNVLGLFSGIGGFEEGLRRAGFKIDAYCEIEEYCLRVLRKNFPESKEYNDVRDIDPTGYDVYCGGFPCQDISISGKNKGLLGGEKSSLWLNYRNAIKIGKPKYVIIENVSALLGRGLEIILQDLAEIGYDATWTTFDSKYFGVPQRRRRVYIVGVRDGIPSNTDLFEHSYRDSREQSHSAKISSVNESFEWDCNEVDQGRKGFTFLTLQRSDQFAEIGLSSALCKRDYKQFTDLVVMDGVVRRVAPNERLLLQGFPIDWWDECGLTDAQKYMCNGMTLNVTEHIGELILDFDSRILS